MNKKNIFLIPLLVASMLILGVIAYASLQGTETRSKAANEVKCTLPTKNKTSGKSICKTGFTLNDKNMCCSSSTTKTVINVSSTPIPTPISSTFIIHLAPDGNDTNPGTSEKPIKSLPKAQQILLAQKPQVNVEIRIKPGTYYDGKVSWKYYNPDHSISFLPEGYTPGTTLTASTVLPVFDGQHSAPAFINVSAGDGKPSNIRFYYLKIQNYVNGITIKGNEADKNKWNGSNVFYGLYFYSLGNKQSVDPNAEKGVAAIDLINSRGNVIEQCTFDTLVNRKETEDALHSIYLAHYSSQNTIKNNLNNTVSGPAFKARDGSNNNVFTGNTFKDVKFAFLDSYGDGECPSWNNTLAGNTYQGTRTGNVSAITAPDSLPAWCTKPAPDAKRTTETQNSWNK